MSVSNYIRSYLPLAKFLAEILTENNEVVLIDLTQSKPVPLAVHHELPQVPLSTIIDQALSATAEKGHFVKKHLELKTADQALVSSSFVIRYDAAVVALLCVITDERCFSNLSTGLNQLMQLYNGKLQVSASYFAQENSLVVEDEEHFATSSMDFVDSVLKDYLYELSIKKAYMQRENKIECVRRLYHQGFFQLKDSVSIAANVMGASVPSIYRYLKIVRDEQGPSSNP